RNDVCHDALLALSEERGVAASLLGGYVASQPGKRALAAYTRDQLGSDAGSSNHPRRDRQRLKPDPLAVSDTRRRACIPGGHAHRTLPVTMPENHSLALRDAGGTCAANARLPPAWEGAMANRSGFAAPLSISLTLTVGACSSRLTPPPLPPGQSSESLVTTGLM